MSKTPRHPVLAAAVLAASACLAVPAALAQDRATRVRKDREEVGADPRWIYNDLDAGFARAGKTGRPLMVVLRCIP